MQSKALPKIQDDAKVSTTNRITLRTWRKHEKVDKVAGTHLWLSKTRKRQRERVHKIKLNLQSQDFVPELDFVPD